MSSSSRRNSCRRSLYSSAPASAYRFSSCGFAGPEQVLDYLGRYTHRIAIGDQRLCSLRDGSVRFRYTDYRRTGACRRRS